VQLCSRWEDFNWHRASCNPSSNETLLLLITCKTANISVLITLPARSWGCEVNCYDYVCAISEMKGLGWRAIPTQWRKASDILTSTMAAFLFSSHPKLERDREAHSNYYASTYNMGRQLSYRKTKLNQIRQKQTCILNQKCIQHKTNTKKLKPGLVASYDIRPGNGVGLFW